MADDVRDALPAPREANSLLAPEQAITEVVLWVAATYGDAVNLSNLWPVVIHRSAQPFVERLRDGLQRLAREHGMVEGRRVPAAVAERFPKLRGAFVSYAEVRGKGTGPLNVALGDGVTPGCPHDGKLTPARRRGGRMICMTCGATVHTTNHLITGTDTP